MSLLNTVYPALLAMYSDFSLFLPHNLRATKVALAKRPVLKPYAITGKPSGLRNRHLLNLEHASARDKVPLAGNRPL